MERERYSIEVSENRVIIYGSLTIEEAFDFLNFFERKGYRSVELGSENSTLCMLKIDQTEVITNEKITDLRDELKLYKDRLDNEQLLHYGTIDKLKDTEKLLKQLMSEEYDKYKNIREENQKLIRDQTLLYLQQNPEVDNIIKKISDEYVSNLDRGVNAY